MLFPTEKVDTFLMGFFGDRRIKRAARQHGINGKIINLTFLLVSTFILRNRKHVPSLYQVSVEYYSTKYTNANAVAGGCLRNGYVFFFFNVLT